MKLVQSGAEYALVELKPDDDYPAYQGAHCHYDHPDPDHPNRYAYGRNMLDSCEHGGYRGWRWTTLSGRIGSLAVVSRHDYLQLSMQNENEFGLVTP